MTTTRRTSTLRKGRLCIWLGYLRFRIYAAENASDSCEMLSGLNLNRDISRDDGKLVINQHMLLACHFSNPRLALSVISLAHSTVLILSEKLSNLQDMSLRPHNDTEV